MFFSPEKSPHPLMNPKICNFAYSETFSTIGDLSKYMGVLLEMLIIGLDDGRQKSSLPHIQMTIKSFLEMLEA